MTPYMGNLNINIKALRERKGWSQQALAEKIGVKQSTIAAYEAGRNEPNLAVLIKLATCFDVSLDHLAGLESADAESMLLYRKLCRLNAGDRYIIQRVLDAFNEQPKNNEPPTTI